MLKNVDAFKKSDVIELSFVKLGRYWNIYEIYIL